MLRQPPSEQFKISAPLPLALIPSRTQERLETLVRNLD